VQSSSIILFSPLLYFFLSLSLDGGRHHHNQHHHHHHHNGSGTSTHNSLTSSSSAAASTSSSSSSEFVANSFETTNNTHVTAQIGGTAVLPCIVDASSPATVTWIRRSDYQLLTGPAFEFINSRAIMPFLASLLLSNRSRPGHVQQ
jgi:hypothetical protein